MKKTPWDNTSTCTAVPKYFSADYLPSFARDSPSKSRYIQWILEINIQQILMRGILKKGKKEVYFKFILHHKLKKC